MANFAKIAKNANSGNFRPNGKADSEMTNKWLTMAKFTQKSPKMANFVKIDMSVNFGKLWKKW